MMEIWPYFLAELLRYGGGVPVAISANLISHGIVAGLRAVFTHDPIEALQQRALKALEASIPAGKHRKALWRCLGEIFRESQLVSRDDWCRVLTEQGCDSAAAAGLYDELERDFSSLVAEAARRDSRVFMQVALDRLRELNAKNDVIVGLVSGIPAVLAQGQASAAELAEIKRTVQEVLDRLTQRLPVALLPRQIRSPRADFTGREAELRELLIQLETGGVTICGVRGMGGVGKTELALKLAEQLKARYPDAQIFLDLKGTSTQTLSAGDTMAHVIHAFYPELKAPEREGELAGLYRSVLDGKRALLLMDNAAGADQVLPIIPPPGCLLLVTSRRHFTLPALYSINLDALPADDARELLLKIAPRIGNQADEFANLCGYLPMALRLAASAVAEYADMPVADYMRRLKDKYRGEYAEAALATSYDLLSAEMQKLWRALAVFPGSFNVLAAEAVWELQPDPAQDALSALVASSMIEWEGQTTKTNSHRLHDLARVYADSRLSDAERDAVQRRHAAHFLVALRAGGWLYLQGGENVMRGLGLFDLERGDIEAGQEWAAAHAADDDAAARLCSDYPQAGAYVLDVRLNPREQIAWLQPALECARRLNDREAEGRHLCGLGIAYVALGEPRRAIEFHEQHWEIGRATSDRWAQAAALGGLGVAYARLGQMRKAIEFSNRALAISREIGDRRGEAGDVGNLGNAYLHLGEPRKAIEFCEQQLEIARNTGNHVEERSALGSLGNAHLVIGETRRAMKFYQQSLEIARKIGNLWGEGNALWNMSLALDQLGEREKAIASAEAALAIYEQIEDPNAAKVHKQLEEWRREE